MTSRAASADGKAATKPPRQRPKARDVKERAKGKRPRRPPPIGHRQALPDQLEDPNEYGVRVGSFVEMYVTGLSVMLLPLVVQPSCIIAVHAAECPSQIPVMERCMACGMR